MPYSVVAHAESRIHQLQTYRLFETLSSGLATIPATYTFQAPDRMESSVNGESQAIEPSDVFNVAAEIQVIPMEVKERRGLGIASVQPPAV